MEKTDIEDIYLGAVEKDKGWDVKVYIINTSDVSKELQLLQGSFQGDTDSLLVSGKCNKTPFQMTEQTNGGNIHTRQNF